MSVRRRYALSKGGMTWEVSAASEPPSWLRMAGVSVEAMQSAGSEDAPLGPNYDGSANSVRAAILYEPRRVNNRHKVLVYLLRNTHRWVPNSELRSVGGGSADRRLRELDEQGWPIARRPPQDSVGSEWGYCLDLSPEGTEQARNMLSRN